LPAMEPPWMDIVYSRILASRTGRPPAHRAS
jgi:hypothetical protein